uniref:E3 ubiquitin-protein ligase n=1 Tax=Anopheles atroparvus TaxID=41427 RepID=A0AAG5CW03_ANOAO
MAESLQSNSPSPTSARSEDGDSHEIPKKPDATTADSKLECPVCLQTCVHPVRLPCGHIFCFLCVKGVAFKNLRCAMCRCDIPLTYLDHPQLVNGVEEIERAATATVADGNEYQWYYEGCNGWWQYDERTSQELEEAYLEGKKSCKILVAGFVYIVTFEHKCQIRQNDYSRIRRVKRDLVTIQKKGVAGLRLEANAARASASTGTSDLNELSSAMGDMNLNEGASTSTTSSARTANVVNGVVSAGDARSQAESASEGVDTEHRENSGSRADPAEEPSSISVLSANTGSDSSNSSTSSSDSSTNERGIAEALIDLNVQQEYVTTDEEGDDDDNLLIL